MANDFTLSSVKNARLIPEKLLFATYLPTLAAAGSLSVVNQQRWMPRRLVQLTDLRLQNSADLQAIISYDGNQVNLNAAAGPSTYGTNAADVLNAASNLQIELFNNSTGALSDVRYSYATWIRRPSVADKLALDLPLNKLDQQLVQKFPQLQNHVKQGFPLPIPLAKRLQQLYQGEIVPHWYNIDTSTSEATVDVLKPSVDHALVLRKIAMGPGTAATNITVNVDRDGQNEYLSVDQYAFNQDIDYDVFIPAVDNLTFTATAVSGTPTLNLRVGVQEVRLTTLLRLVMGLADPDDYPALWDRLEAGII